MTQIAFFVLFCFELADINAESYSLELDRQSSKKMSHSAVMPFLKPQRLDSLCIANSQYFPPFHVLVSYAVLKIVSNALLTESAFRWNGFRKNKTA